ncbi:MAG: hypothetical protein Q9163_001907 [Psora crenata]
MSQRPLSITSLPRPQSPALETPNSPKHPIPRSHLPDPIHAPLPTPPSRSPAGPSAPFARPVHMPPSIRSVSADSSKAHTGGYATPSTGNLSPRGVYTKGLSDAEKSGGEIPPKSPLRAGSPPRRILEGAKNVVPPPINRADKPVVLTKHQTVMMEPRPKIPSFDVNERGTPSRSPSSSDSSSDDDEAPNLSRDNIDKTSVRETTGVLPSDGRQLSAPYISSQLQGEKSTTEIESESALQVTGVRVYSTGPRTGRPRNIEDNRPGLPPRRQREGRARSGSKTQSNLIPTNVRPLSEDRYSTKAKGPQRASSSENSTICSSLPSSDKKTASFHLQLTEDHGPAGHLSAFENKGESDYGIDAYPGNTANFPDISNMDRRFPHSSAGSRAIHIGYDARLLDICARHLCTAGHVTRVWDVTTGDCLLSLGHAEKDIKITALVFKPGTKASEEGSCLWLGTNYGDIQELDVPTQRVVYTKSGAHERHEIVKILRHQNTMWSLDDGGNLCVWPSDEAGLPSLQDNPKSHRVPRGHTCSLVIQDTLWLATGREIRVFRPRMGDSPAFHVLQAPLGQPHLGPITSGSVIGGQTDRVYFGHIDGKISVYSILDYSCLAVVNVNVYRITSLVGAGFYLWAVYSTGMVCVYDTRTAPWTTMKGWMAHQGNPITNLAVDRSSLWKTGILRVASLGSDNAVRFWDGTLENEWIASDMRDREVEYCTFNELSAEIVTWNAGAATPAQLRYGQADSGSFRNTIHGTESPDLLVFGFQELVDLEDKTLTAKSLLKGNRKKEYAEHDPMSGQYRVWRDYLVKYVEESVPSHEPYQLLHTANMVGLFSCVFIKASQRNRIQKVSACEIKRGMGGLHGNKGALILRFVFDDSSICLVNCHLAAGQTQTSSRNTDVTAILESEVLPGERDAVARSKFFIDGGDGSMILDHEICIFAGDLNYRIDTMGRDTVIKAVKANNLSKLLERDQLLVSRRRNPMFRIRTLMEAPISFPPTYKYDVGTDTYDTSEKRRSPAWCDRILYRGAGRIKQLNYQRHELRASDHRPVSGTFKIRIKSISEKERAQAWTQCARRFETVKEQLVVDSKYEGLNPKRTRAQR